jgi:hypothetical protein
MMRRRLLWISGFAMAGVAALLIGNRYQARSSGILGEAIEMNPDRKVIARLHRLDRDLHIELLYFPSFESTFEDPKVTQDAQGRVTVSLTSYASGPFYRTSEQQTNLSFKVPSSSVKSGATVQFYSGDYDQVFATVKAP